MANQAGDTVQLQVPQSLKRQFAIDAAKEGVAKRFIILRALAASGCEVATDELRDRRKGRQ